MTLHRLGTGLSGVLLSALTLASSPFPEPEAVAPNVEFWSRVFSEWRVGQAVVHDSTHLRLVYEVVDLPGTVSGRYTREQQEFIDGVLDGWRAYLEYLEDRRARAQPLEPSEKAWVEHIEAMAGPDALAGASTRLRSQRGLREQFRAGLERAARYERPMRAIFRERGLPEDLALLPHVESSFQWQARSSAGATGLWQFTRGTGRRYLTIHPTIDERLDPIAAARGAARYLEDAYTELGSWPAALTSYNHGVAGMRRALDRHGSYEEIFREYRGPLFGFASRNFYAEFLAARNIAANPEAYFPEGLEPHAEMAEDALALAHRATAASIAETYGVSLDVLRELNLGWLRKPIDSGLPLPAGITVWLPPGTLERLRDASGAVPMPPEAPAPAETWYVVRRGDTLSGIASRHGMSAADLRDRNGLSTRSHLIVPGQRLRVESLGVPTVHRVRRGDTLSEIASRYGVRLSELRAANGFSSRASRIHVGQSLTIPGAGRRHTVAHGDTLLEIAARYRVRLLDLLHLNTIELDSVIHPGQTLQIP